MAALPPGSGGGGKGLGGKLKDAGTALSKCRQDLRVKAALQDWWDLSLAHMRSGKMSKHIQRSTIDEDTYFAVFTKVRRGERALFIRQQWQRRHTAARAAEARARTCGRACACGARACVCSAARHVRSAHARGVPLAALLTCAARECTGSRVRVVVFTRSRAPAPRPPPHSGVQVHGGGLHCGRRGGVGGC